MSHQPQKDHVILNGYFVYGPYTEEEAKDTLQKLIKKVANTFNYKGEKIGSPDCATDWNAEWNHGRYGSPLKLEIEELCKTEAFSI